MITWSVDSNNDTFLTDNGQISLADGIDALSQKVKQRLLTFLGEWFLDTTRGVPYFQNILGSGNNRSVITNLLTTEIKKEQEVISVTNVSFSYSANDRKYSYSSTIESQFGKKEVSISGYY